MAARPFNILSLCAGIGGLDLGVRLALPELTRTVCMVEQDVFAASALVARMDDAALDPCPVWDDIHTFDGGPWRGLVDLVTAGFPCQPFSLAGGRKGTEDERWIWPEIERIVREVQPKGIFLENVPNLLFDSRAFGRILGFLAEGGFIAEWDCFSAREIGAPHIRERLFLLALADSARGGLDEALLRPEGLRLPAGCGGDFLFPPGPDELDQWREIIAADPSVEPGLLRGPDGVPPELVRSLPDRIRCLGNAVVPEVAALAFETLFERLNDD